MDKCLKTSDKEAIFLNPLILTAPGFILIEKDFKDVIHL